MPLLSIHVWTLHSFVFFSRHLIIKQIIFISPLRRKANASKKNVFGFLIPVQLIKVSNFFHISSTLIVCSELSWNFAWVFVRDILAIRVKKRTKFKTKWNNLSRGLEEITKIVSLCDQCEMERYQEHITVPSLAMFRYVDDCYTSKLNCYLSEFVQVAWTVFFYLFLEIIFKFVYLLA